MHDLGRAAPPWWLRSSSIGWGAALLACVVLVLGAGFMAREVETLDASEIQSAELYARVLQDHAERTFNTVDIAMAALDDTVVAEGRSDDAALISSELTRSLAGLAFLRSLSLMDAGGRVLASSAAGNIGAVVDLKAIPLPAQDATDRLGTSVGGRDLLDARAVRTAAFAGPQNFVPLVRSVRLPSGDRRYLVAVLNTDFFANDYELTLADATRGAGIFGLDGVMFAGTGSVGLAPGQRIAGHGFFTQFLPARESGSFIGPGIDGSKVVTAFRVLRKRPVLVIVERNHAQILSRLHGMAVWTACVCVGALLVIAGAMLMGWKSLRRHEAVSAALEATRVEIASSERDLRALVESVHELIFRTDAVGNVTFVNGRWMDLTGRPMHDFVGRRLALLCPAGERAACEALFVPRPGAAGTVLLHIEHGSGGTLAFEMSVSPVPGAGGQTLGFAGFAVDVSAREAAQQALQTQLTFTAQLLEMSPTPIFVKDAQGRFVTVNRAWLELMDLSLHQVSGRDSSDLYGQEGPKHKDQDARLLLSGERISYENRLVVAGRAPRDTVVTKVRFTRADGTAAGIVGSIIDVTEFREAERNIRKARDAAQLANSARSEFIANISHELRTPLQGIIGFSEIGRDMADALPDVVELFTDIHAGGRRMLTLVNGLLDVSQMDSTVGSLPLQRVDLARLVRDAVGQLQSKAMARQLKVVCAGLDQRVEGEVDSARFQQAVRNVLDNAIRYSPAGGCIDVALVDRGVSGIELSVRDRGPGIPAEELELVFEAFVQSSRTRDGSGGTGLGLTIARKIMRAYGGSIVAENAAGGGVLVRLALPAAVAAADTQGDGSRHDADAVQAAPAVN